MTKMEMADWIVMTAEMLGVKIPDRVRLRIAERLFDEIMDDKDMSDHSLVLAARGRAYCCDESD